MRKLLATALVALAITACGGGGTEDDLYANEEVPADAPVDDRWQVGDPLVSVAIQDIAEYEGEAVAEAYVTYYECVHALATDDVKNAEAVIMAGEASNIGDITYNKAVSITNEYMDDTRQCESTFAATTGQAPFAPWPDPVTGF